MPKSKKTVRVNLTQTAKKDREFKSKIVSDVRDAIDSYSSLYLFSYNNMRSNKFKQVRMDFLDSRIFMGKNKLLQLAMGKTAEDEYKDNLSKVSKLASGSVGLLMTSRPKAEVLDYFKSFSSLDFARAGSNASQTITLTQSQVEVHPVSMIEQFRKLGVPVHVVEGKVCLVNGKDYVVCKEGTVLTAEQAKLLCHFGVKSAVFEITMVARWEEEDFEEL